MSGEADRDRARTRLFFGENDPEGVINRMRPALKIVPALSVLILGGLAGLFLVARAGAEDEPAPAKSARGGLLAKTDQHQIEVFFYPTGIRLFPQDSAGKSRDATNLSAIAIFYHPSSPNPWFDRPLRPSSATAGESPSSLEDFIGLGTVPATGAKVVFEVSGLAGADDPPTSFTVPVEFVTGQGGAAADEGSASPRFVYAAGSQGVGYYANPGPQSAPPAAAGARAVSPPRSSASATRSSSRPSTVGPGARDFSTGRRSRLAKPWLPSRG